MHAETLTVPRVKSLGFTSWCVHSSIMEQNMSKKIRLVTLALVAVFITAFAAGTASANTITASPGGAIPANSLGTITFTASGGLINPTIHCTVQLLGSINRSINNVSGSALGTITGGSATGCDNGSAVVLAAAS